MISRADSDKPDGRGVVCMLCWCSERVFGKFVGSSLRATVLDWMIDVTPRPNEIHFLGVQKTISSILTRATNLDTMRICVGLDECRIGFLDRHGHFYTLALVGPLGWCGNKGVSTIGSTTPHGLNSFNSFSLFALIQIILVRFKSWLRGVGKIEPYIQQRWTLYSSPNIKVALFHLAFSTLHTFVSYRILHDRDSIFTDSATQDVLFVRKSGWAQQALPLSVYIGQVRKNLVPFQNAHLVFDNPQTTKAVSVKGMRL